MESIDNSTIIGAFLFYPHLPKMGG